MGQTLGSQRDPWAGEEEPKLPWDAKAVLVEVADGGFPVFLGGGRSRWERHSGLQTAADRYILFFFFLGEEAKFPFQREGWQGGCSWRAAGTLPGKQP